MKAIDNKVIQGEGDIDFIDPVEYDEMIKKWDKQIRKLGPAVINETGKATQIVLSDSAMQREIPGSTRRDWNFMVQGAWQLFMLMGRMPTYAEMKQDLGKYPWWPKWADKNIEDIKDIKVKELAAEIYANPKFGVMCYQRGIRGGQALDHGLDERMTLALSVLTDVSRRDKLNSRLASIGVSSAEYASWMRYKPFREAMEKHSTLAMNHAQSAVDVALTAGAVDGNLEFIKYFHAVTGKYDPTEKQMINVQQMVKEFVDILIKYLAPLGPQGQDLMRSIGAEMQLVAKANGVK